MAEKSYHFIAGLPCSGAELLCEVLAENPRFCTSEMPGILGAVSGVGSGLAHLPEFKAFPNDAGRLRVMQGILQSYYSARGEPVIFDRSDSAPALLEMIEMLIGKKAKVLVPIRDMREVLASLELLSRQDLANGQVLPEIKNSVQFQTAKGRADIRLRNDQPLGIAYNRIRDALQRGFVDRIFLVNLDDVVLNPENSIERIYQFLGEKPFKHDLGRIRQLGQLQTQWPTVLGAFAEEYDRYNFWKR